MIHCSEGSLQYSQDPALVATNPSISPTRHGARHARPFPFFPNDALTAHHWYKRLPPRPPRHRRYGSSVVNNIWNAGSNWDNAVQGSPAGLLETMRVQVSNLKQMIDASGLDTSQKPFLQQLIGETKQAFDALNPAMLNQQASRTSFRSTAMRRLASEESAISSNAKADLGCMAYLQDDNLFPGCAGTYQYVRERLEQIFRIMDGEYQVGDVEGIRQQQQAALAPQQAAPMTLNADGTMTPYTSPSAGSTALPASQIPNPAQVQGYAPMQTISPSTLGAGQTAAPSPVAGLEAKQAPWEGTPNTTEDGQETVGRGQDWFSTYGTTLDQFAARCSRWLRANGGGQAALVEHSKQNTVPENVIGQVLPYV